MAVADLLSRVRIKAMIYSDRKVGDQDIDIDVRNGSAILQGHVESEEQKLIAERLAREIDGIREVNNKIMVGSETITTEELLTQKVSKRIAEDGRITSKDIQVTDEGNSIVRLQGTVDSVEEYYLVQEAAESVEGVQTVKNDLKIEEPHTHERCQCGRM